MTVEKDTTPKKGARFATKRRVLTILLILLCSFIFVLWQERPRLTLYNMSNETLLYTVKLNNQESSVGSIPANTKTEIDLPFIKGRNASVYFQAKTSSRIISAMARTELLGGISFYIQPDFNISMTATPTGFLTEQEDTDEIIVK